MGSAARIALCLAVVLLLVGCIAPVAGAQFSAGTNKPAATSPVGGSPALRKLHGAIDAIKEIIEQIKDFFVKMTGGETRAMKAAREAAEEAERQAQAEAARRAAQAKAEVTCDPRKSEARAPEDAVWSASTAPERTSETLCI